jgi:hypothetical protein
MGSCCLSSFGLLPVEVMLQLLRRVVNPQIRTLATKKNVMADN